MDTCRDRALAALLKKGATMYDGPLDSRLGATGLLICFYEVFFHTWVEIVLLPTTPHPKGLE